MNKYEKAKKLCAALVKCCPNRNIFWKLSPAEILNKCSSDELDFYFSKICVKEGE